MADGRIAEHVGAVAERGDDEGVGRRELGAKRCAEAPAEPAGGAEREEECPASRARNDRAAADIR